MSDQNIDITLRTVGADAAAAEIRKVEAAEKGLNQETRGFAGGADAPWRSPEIQAEADAQRRLNEVRSDEVKTIFKKIEGTAQEAQMESDLAEALQRKAKATAEAAAESAKGGQAGKLIDAAGYGQELEAVKSIAKKFGLEITAQAVADVAVITGSVAAVAAAGVVAAKSVTASVDDYDAAMKKLEEVTGKTSKAGTADVSALTRAVADSTHQVEGFLGQVGEYGGKLVDVFAHPINTLRDMRKWLDGTADLEAGIKRAEDAVKALAAMKQERADAAQVNLEAIYDLENKKLIEQEETLKRISDLRSKLDSAEKQRAALAVTDAKRSGGDVALAEANQLATNLAADLNALKGSLAKTQLEATTAKENADQAFGIYKNALQNGASPAKITELAQKVDDTSNLANKATEKLQDQTAVFQAEKANLLEDTQGKLLDFANDAKTTVSKVSEAAMKGIENTLKTELANAPQDIATKLKPELAAVNETAQKAVSDDFSKTAEEQSKALTGKLNQAAGVQGAEVSVAILANQAVVNQILADCATALKQSQDQERATRKLEEAATANATALQKIMQTYLAIEQSNERTLRQMQRDISAVQDQLNRR